MVIVLAYNAEALAGADTGPMQEEKEFWVALVEAGDVVALALDGLGKRRLSALLALGRDYRQHRIAVRTGAGLAHEFARLNWPTSLI